MESFCFEAHFRKINSLQTRALYPLKIPLKLIHCNKQSSHMGHCSISIVHSIDSLKMTFDKFPENVIYRLNSGNIGIFCPSKLLRGWFWANNKFQPILPNTIWKHLNYLGRLKAFCILLNADMNSQKFMILMTEKLFQLERSLRKQTNSPGGNLIVYYKCNNKWLSILDNHKIAQDILVMIEYWL